MRACGGRASKRWESGCDILSNGDLASVTRRSKTTALALRTHKRSKGSATVRSSTAPIISNCNDARDTARILWRSRIEQWCSYYYAGRFAWRLARRYAKNSLLFYCIIILYIALFMMTVSRQRPGIQRWLDWEHEGDVKGTKASMASAARRIGEMPLPRDDGLDCEWS